MFDKTEAQLLGKLITLRNNKAPSSTAVPDTVIFPVKSNDDCRVVFFSGNRPLKIQTISNGNGRLTKPTKPDEANHIRIYLKEGNEWVLKQIFGKGNAELQLVEVESFFHRNLVFSVNIHNQLEIASPIAFINNKYWYCAKTGQGIITSVKTPDSVKLQLAKVNSDSPAKSLVGSSLVQGMSKYSPEIHDFLFWKS
jgi:hypothetical protein